VVNPIPLTAHERRLLIDLRVAAGQRRKRRPKAVLSWADGAEIRLIHAKFTA